MLKFCVNRIMALQELQALGKMAVGFERSGCYKCPGIDESCDFYTPIAWVYEKEADVPHHVSVFIPDEGADEK
jgi:hypothetical protein